MSRIGDKPIDIPNGVKVSVADCTITVEGKLGKLEWTFRPEITVKIDDETKKIVCSRIDNERQSRALHGLSRALIQNIIVGVTDGYEKRLELVGVGYVAVVQSGRLELRVGYANELHKIIPDGLDVACPDQQHIVVKGIDKQLVGQFAAETRALRKPEPYKGKGIRYFGEQVKRKQGKAMVK
ncbi:MAG: 50S ribosomal protein L6 [Planctomycetota bacterium]|nr:50S ribosomal protein L6 [Planctomycetota bacterium]